MHVGKRQPQHDARTQSNCNLKLPDAGTGCGERLSPSVEHTFHRPDGAAQRSTLSSAQCHRLSPRTHKLGAGPVVGVVCPTAPVAWQVYAH
jgi:hypothetical protein